MRTVSEPVWNMKLKEPANPHNGWRFFQANFWNYDSITCQPRLIVPSIFYPESLQHLTLSVDTGKLQDILNFLQAKSNSHIHHPFFPPGKSRRPKTYWTLFSLDQIVTYVGFGFCEKNQLHNPPGHPGQLIIRPMLSHGKIAQLVRSSDCRQYLMKPFLHLRTHTSWKSMYYQAINVMAITRGPLHWMQKHDIPQMLDHSQHICNEGSKCRKMFETTRIHFGWNVCSCYRCGRSFKTQQSKVIRLGFPLHFAPCVCVCVGSQVRHCTCYYFSPMSMM